MKSEDTDPPVPSQPLVSKGGPDSNRTVYECGCWEVLLNSDGCGTTAFGCCDDHKNSRTPGTLDLDIDLSKLPKKDFKLPKFWRKGWEK